MTHRAREGSKTNQCHRGKMGCTIIICTKKPLEDNKKYGTKKTRKPRGGTEPTWLGATRAGQRKVSWGEERQNQEKAKGANKKRNKKKETKKGPKGKGQNTHGELREVRAHRNQLGRKGGGCGKKTSRLNKRERGKTHGGAGGARRQGWTSLKRKKKPKCRDHGKEVACQPPEGTRLAVVMGKEKQKAGKKGGTGRRGDVGGTEQGKGRITGRRRGQVQRAGANGRTND